jgi:acetylglutamate kinase
MMPKLIVIKLGGSALENSLSELSLTVQGHRERGDKVVLVHGGGPAINKELTTRGITWTFVNGQRRTTPDMMSVIEDVLAGSVNALVVKSLRQAGIAAHGLSGGNFLFCRPVSEDLGLVGQVEVVACEAINEALARGEVPVIAPIGRGYDTHMRFNVNADWAATQIAIALRADELTFLTDQNGILNSDGSLVKKADPSRLESMISSGVVSGGMCTKVLAMISAVRHGVAQVRVLNAAKSSGSLGKRKVGTILHEHAS